MFTRLLLASLLFLTIQQPAFADATIPTKDIQGARDNLIAQTLRGIVHREL